MLPPSPLYNIKIQYNITLEDAATITSLQYKKQELVIFQSFCRTIFWHTINIISDWQNVSEKNQNYKNSDSVHQYIQNLTPN